MDLSIPKEDCEMLSNVISCSKMQHNGAQTVGQGPLGGGGGHIASGVTVVDEVGV